MQDNLEIFLLVAEELSFTKAAEKAFVSQQTASYHIKCLEDQYQVKLFKRRPSLSLTKAGKVLYNSLRNIKAIETSIDEQISDIKGESIGELKVGINTVRARIIMPGVLPEYIKSFPRVKTTFIIYDTSVLADMLIDNRISMFIGVNTKSHNAFNRKIIRSEKVYFLSTAKFLKIFKHLNDNEIKDLKKCGINIRDFDKIPTIRNLDGCAMNTIIDNSIANYDIHLPEIINTSDYDIQIDLCGNSIAAAFCPSMILYKVIEHNKLYKGTDKEILIFKINDLEDSLRIDIVTSSLIPNPKYLNVFIKNFYSEAIRKYEYLDSWLIDYFKCN